VDPEAILEIDPIEDTLEKEEDVDNDEGYEEGVGDPGPDRPPNTRPVAGAGTLRAQPTNLKPGDETLSVFIEKWGFKDGASKFRDPQVVVSVRNMNGDPVEAVQETPVPRGQGAANQNYVFFEKWVHIQTTLNKLGSKCAIFFEFRHYKPDKKKRSIKSYCMLEMDEIRSGPIQLEIYKKPANYKRNRDPSLLSVKPFYLHLDLRIDTVEG